MTGFHCISGLPRSGSTLLSALLGQNPAFRTGISSPALGLARNVIGVTGTGEMMRLVNAEQKKAIVKGVIEGYYASILGEARTIVDTNRLWTANLPLLADLYPEAKVICCVRDVAWVVDSVERMLRENLYEQTHLFQSAQERATVYGRAEALMKQERLVGSAWTALREGFYSDQSDRLLIVEYDLLAQHPERVLRLVYEFLGETYFDGHDFENVSFDAPSFDEALGLKGMHKVRPKVALEPRRTVLPADVFRKLQEYAFWRDTTGSAAHVLTQSPAPAGATPDKTGIEPGDVAAEAAEFDKFVTNG